VERDVPARWRCQRAGFARNSPGTSSSTFKAERSSDEEFETKILDTPHEPSASAPGLHLPDRTQSMKISIAATNPCHLYDLARGLHAEQALGRYYSGYPRWKLPDAGSLPLSTHSLRTTVTYGLRRWFSERWRPSDRALFRWQDRAFDAWVSRKLMSCDFFHGLPGQCRASFLSAQKLGIPTVLNHATGPVTDLVERVRGEYERVGLDPAGDSIFDEAYLAQQEEETAMADYHCVGSTMVAEQLAASGIYRERIWVVPYGVDSAVFPGTLLPDRGDQGDRDAEFRILFAGQLCLRKGLRFLLDALESAGQPKWRLDLYGPAMAETAGDLERYQGDSELQLHGAVSQDRLALAFRQAHLLVLPSLEEGFGLVVIQALACGLPCIVSDAVGAKDVIRHRENGSVVPAGDSEALAAEILWWKENGHPIAEERFEWQDSAQTLMGYSRLDS